MKEPVGSATLSERVDEYMKADVDDEPFTSVFPNADAVPTQEAEESLVEWRMLLHVYRELREHRQGVFALRQKQREGENDAQREDEVERKGKKRGAT